MDTGADRALALVASRHAQRRAFNQRLAGLEGAESAVAESLFRCECGLIACGATIRLTPHEYDELRAEPRHYAVLAAHVMSDADRVVATHRGWVIVEPAHALPGDRTAGPPAAHTTQPRI